MVRRFHEPPKKPKNLEYNKNIFCLLLRKTAGYLKKNYSTDEGRRQIIAAKYRLSQCTVMYMALKSYTCIDDPDRWVDDTESRILGYPMWYSYYKLDTKTDILIKVGSEYSVSENHDWRYNHNNIRLDVNDIRINNAADKVVTLCVMDTMSEMRASIIELEQEQIKREKLDYIKGAYDKGL